MLKFADLPTSNIVILIILSLMGIFVCYFWIKELFFYGGNGWDFSIDSGKVGISLGVEGSEPNLPMSNRTRVLFGYPIILLILLIFMFVFTLIRFEE